MGGSWKVEIPNWQNYYIKSNNTKAKYWEWKNRDKLPKKYQERLALSPLIVGAKAFCINKETKERFIKNPKKVGNPNIWMLNGQDLYNGLMNWRLRKNVAKFYHKYFGKYIAEQLEPIKLKSGEYFSISCDIYEVKRSTMPDISNLWPLEKFFEDALQEQGIIPDDSPEYVRESGRKCYHFVESPEDRKLVFVIKIMKL